MRTWPSSWMSTEMKTTPIHMNTYFGSSWFEPRIPVTTQNIGCTRTWMPKRLKLRSKGVRLGSKKYTNDLRVSSIVKSRRTFGKSKLLVESHYGLEPLSRRDADYTAL